MDFDSSFVVFQIFIPVISCAFLAICCASFCKLFHSVRKERQERLHNLASQAQARDQAAGQATDQAVYVIPISVSEEDGHRPPHYSTVQLYEPPPAYDELQLKPDISPPPAYSESIFPPASQH